MRKDEQIRYIHKILWVKEDVDNPAMEDIDDSVFDACLANTITRFAGLEIEPQLKNKIIETLSGLRLRGSSLPHKDVRSAVLGLMNDIERGE